MTGLMSNPMYWIFMLPALLLGLIAQAWVKTHGKGRIFYAGCGHRTEVWWNPAILRFYLDAIQFAAGDLDGDGHHAG